jgi:hypothetical protein
MIETASKVSTMLTVDRAESDQSGGANGEVVKFASSQLFGIRLPRICSRTATNIRTIQELLGHRHVETTMILPMF